MICGTLYSYFPFFILITSCYLCFSTFISHSSSALCTSHVTPTWCFPQSDSSFFSQSFPESTRLGHICKLSSHSIIYFSLIAFADVENSTYVDFHLEHKLHKAGTICLHLPFFYKGPDIF